MAHANQVPSMGQELERLAAMVAEQEEVIQSLCRIVRASITPSSQSACQAKGYLQDLGIVEEHIAYGQWLNHQRKRGLL